MEYSLDSLKTLFEVLEVSSNVQKYLIDGEIALNDGDVSLTQKCSSNASQLLDVMINDSFLELVEMLDIEHNEVNDYDYPSTLDLLKQLSLVNEHIAQLLNLFADDYDDKVGNIIKINLIKAINTVTEIATSLYFN